VFNWTSDPEPVYHPGESLTLCYDLEPHPTDGYGVEIYRSLNSGPWLLLLGGRDDGTGDCLAIALPAEATGRQDYLIVFSADGRIIAQAQTYIFVEDP
jgi:hypothetical protein